MPTHDPAPTRGEAREDAILTAALELLAETGYADMSMDAIAARARSSKATIYRRWSGKSALVVAAIQRHAGHDPAPPPDIGDLRGDLLAVLGDMRDRLAENDARLVLGLMSAMRDDAELTRAVRAVFIDVKRAAFAEVIRRAADRGEGFAAAEQDLLVEVSSAMLFSRMFVTGEALDDTFLAHLVDDVVLPLLRHRTQHVSGSAAPAREAQR